MHYRFLFFLIFSSFLFSQNSEFNFKYLQTAEGLSNNNVTAIQQDELGQIWIATSNGLNKYDGNKFTVYRNDPSDKLSITNSEILNVLVDREGYVWSGTFNGLNRFDPKKNKFRRYYSNPKNKKSLTNSLVICSQDMGNGNIWFGTGNGVSIYNNRRGDFIQFLRSKKGKPALSVTGICLDSNKNIWLSTSDGIYKIEKDKANKFTTKIYTFKTDKEVFYVNNIIELSPGVIGVATKYNGLLLFDSASEKFSYSDTISIPKNIDVKDLLKDKSGNLWIATTSGVYIKKPSNEIVFLSENRSVDGTIGQNFIQTIFEDREGTIWLGTHGAGISIWGKSNQNFLHFKNNAISNNITNSIVADSDGTLYFGTEGGSVNIKNNKGEIYELLKVQNDSKTLNLSIQSMMYDDKNLLWIGTLNNGLAVYNVKTKRKLDGYLSKKLIMYTENVGVHSMQHDTHGNVWIGTYGKGLLKYNKHNKSFKIFERPELTTNIAQSIHVDVNDTVITGGLGGVNMLQPQADSTYKCTTFFDKNRFLTFNIKTVYRDSNNTLWAGTTTRGLYKFENNDFKKVFVDVKNRISTVYQILDEGDGILWLSTDKGIVRYNSIKRTSIIYEQNSIVRGNEFRFNSGVVVGQNEFYFGDFNGVTTFNSEKITRIKYVPKVILSDLKIKNESVPVNQDLLPNSLNYTDVLELDYKHSNFSISYALPVYLNSKNNRYAYRLKGLDDTWTYTKNTEAFFTLQTPGTYVFEVKGTYYDAARTKKVTALTIIVNPAPWRTWWAYTLYFILAFIALYGISWVLQSKSRLKHKLLLEQEEKIKNDALNKAKLQFFTNISHEFRTPLTLILGPLQNILDNYSGSNSTYKKLKVIESSANRLLRLINRLMDFRKLESNQLQLATAEGNIVKFLREIFLSFSEHAKNGDYTYEFKTSHEEIFAYYDRYKLERVFYNLIANAFKHTNKGETIRVTIFREAHEVVINVEDSGNGIPDAYIDKIFDRFFEIPNQNNTNQHYKKGTGIGLSIANNIVKLHHGELTVKNIKPKGAVFTVKLKLGRAHIAEDAIIKDFKMSDDVSQYATQIDASNLVSTTISEDLVFEQKKHTILVVEDNMLLRSFIKEILKVSYNVIQAENGKIAFEKALKHMPDLIVSDVIMPEMVGTELCSKIKTTMATSHIPVILLTSRTALVYKFEGLESGADDYISKPFDIKEFALKIKNLLESKERLKDKFLSDTNFKPVDVTLTSIDEQLLEKAFKVVENNIANQDFNVNQFCEELGVSRSVLFTKIKAWTNSTPNEFIQEVRLNHAAKLLELNKISVSEVSQKVGFKRSKYFSQCFKKKYGFTPVEFSKKFSTMDDTSSDGVANT